jgi:hypothetical protein
MRLHFLLAAAALLSCAGSTEPTPPPGAVRVLFVGNSLTYTNDLPAMVRAIALAGGDTFFVKAIAHPDWNLHDHWNDTEAAHEIAADKWDVVVLQQGPSSLPESRLDLLTWSRKFGDLAKIHGACPAMYMVWPALDFATSFDAVRDHYAEAADSIDGLFLPAGEAWRAAWEKDDDLALYGPDAFHPSKLGTYVAALAIYSGLVGRSPVGNMASIAGVSLTAQERLDIQQAVWGTVYGSPRRCSIE